MREPRKLVRAPSQLTARGRAIADPRCDLVETIPAFGTVASRVLVSVVDEACRFDDQKAVANYGALAPTIQGPSPLPRVGCRVS